MRSLSHKLSLCASHALQVRFSFDEPEFAMIDTLFSLAEAHLFMQLVELSGERPDLLPEGKDFATMYRWVPPPFLAVCVGRVCTGLSRDRAS